MALSVLSIQLWANGFRIWDDFFGPDPMEDNDPLLGEDSYLARGSGTDIC